jgi:hypothetical protein
MTNHRTSTRTAREIIAESLPVTALTEEELNTLIAGQDTHVNAMAELQRRAVSENDDDTYAERAFSALEVDELNKMLAGCSTLPQMWIAGRRKRLMLTELHLRALADCPVYVEQGEIDPVTGMTFGQIQREIIKVRSTLNGTLSDTQRASDTAWLNRLVAEASARRAIDDDADKELFKACRFLVSVGIDTGTKYEKALQFHGL